MYPKTFDALMRQENAYKESVYSELERERAKAQKAVDDYQKYVNSGRYEEQDSFTASGSLADARSRCKGAKKVYDGLYHRPYFAHLEVHFQDEETEHFFLSDNDTLNAPILISQSGIEGTLLPFKQDEDRPISAALFHCYQAKDGASISYQSKGGKNTFFPDFICDDEITDRELTNAIQLFPVPDYSLFTADELLEMRLDENRSNPSLTNIIATLQKQQFEIIEAGANDSFVVQGCAGSGKSQCLLHRLFYLRDELSGNAWQNVLLITPTQLFRNYSSDLIHRYQLSDINNCSLAELYKDILSIYDNRFRNRQYLFELTEEYLPDQYLQEVYSEDTIKSIEREVEKALENYVGGACRSLGVDLPVTISAETISSLLQQLDREVLAFDEREKILSEDAEYEEKRKQYELFQKQLPSLQKNLERFTEDQKDINERIAHLKKLCDADREAKQEQKDWKIQRDGKIRAAKSTLEELGKELREGFAYDVPAKYAHQLYVVKSLTSGEECKADEEYLRFLQEISAETEKELSEYLKGQKPEKQLQKLQKRRDEIAERIRSISEEADSVSEKIDEYSEWLREKAGSLDGEKSRITLQRSEMDRARYFLSRIESTIFEQVIWNVLYPIKEKFGVKALDIVVLEENRQKETRILYKSDLLFYVKIYARIHPEAELPAYKLLCIDEGQDLHKADYDMLRVLFPDAVFNVFGDTSQVLHTSCGIGDWKSETGILTVYDLNRNYRNTAAIVEFCNRHFGSSMKAVGKAHREEYPTELTAYGELRRVACKKGTVLIVKDRFQYECLCSKCDISTDSFEFLDTKAEKADGTRNACYTIFAAKGLEFSKVVVYAKDMTMNQKVVACTRAMEELAYYE